MSRKSIAESVQRRLYAESMGMCMNPECQTELFFDSGDIMEKAHISPYAHTEDNSYENLIILCPSCHTKFDKTSELDEKIVKSWKEERKKQLKEFFSVRYESFKELRDAVSPLLVENKTIYNNYYAEGRKDFWDKFESRLLLNNEKLVQILQKNFHLIQSSRNQEYSNLQLVKEFIVHAEEFKCTRNDEEKIRAVLFPKEINSIFGIAPMDDFPIQSVESLEAFLEIMRQNNNLEAVELGTISPYVLLRDQGKVLLNDTPRLRQLYSDYGCWRKGSVRFNDLNCVLKYLKSRGIAFRYIREYSLREIAINQVNIMFVYEYCLSKEFLMRICPPSKTVVVNLHHWNGSGCVSQEALEFAKTLDLTLLPIDDFYKYVHQIKEK